MNERYFLIAFIATPGITGNIAFSIDEFPSKRTIIHKIEDANKEYRPRDVVITNIFEFKSKQDFELYRS